MEKSQCYRARGSHNECSSHTIGYYDRESTAIEAAKGKGFWCDGTVELVTGYTVTVGGKPYFIKESDVHPIQTETQDAVKQRAQEKLSSAALTDDEKAALGLKG